MRVVILRFLPLLICGSIILPAAAQPAPRLNAPPREWIQRGTTNELVLGGENLAAIKDVIISGAPGVTAAAIPPASSKLAVESSLGGISTVAVSDGKKATLKLAIAKDAALNERELRVVTAEGVSNPVTLRVSPYVEVDASNNESREKAQHLKMPLAVSGVIDQAAESHFFKFTGAKGEHVVFDVFAYRLGSKLDSSLAVSDSSGKELARNEDATGLDSTLDFEVPESGEYLLELRDFRFQGGGDFKYRLIAGVTPHAFSAFPFGGQRGRSVEVRLKGVNLEGADKLTLHLAADAPLGRQEIRASTARGLSNPFPFEVSDLPQVIEAEPNSALDQADAITIPAAINGHIGKKGDYDAFRFRARENQRVIFEVHAYRFGSRLDALLILTDGAGNVLQRNDDATGIDARIDHTFKEPGEYLVLIEDLLGRGGEDFGYRLNAVTPAPDYSVAFLSDTPRVRRNGRTPIRCEVTRMNGFDETIKIECEELPSGVFCEPLILTPGMASGLLILHASREAALGSFPLKVAASSIGAGGPSRRNARPFSGDQTVKSAFLTVLEAAPFGIAPATILASIEQNQSANIDVVIERSAGFDGEIKITPEGFSTGRDPITRSFDFQPLVMKPGQTRGTLSLRAKTDSEIVARPIVLRAESAANGIPLVEYSAPVPVATVQIPFLLSTSLRKLVVTALPSGGASAAAEAVFAARVERRGGFNGELELKLEGVPDGVSAAVPKIAADAREATIKLVASDKAPAGKDVSLTLTGIGVHNDRTYRFAAPALTLTINAPAAEESKEPKLAEKAK